MPLRPATFRRVLGLLALASLLLIAGCSVRKLAYNLAGRFLTSTIDSALHLDPAQKHLVHERLPPLLRWHRREELPRYAALLERVRAHVQSSGHLDEAELLAEAGEVQAASERLAAHLAPDAGELLSRLGPPQIAALQKSLDDDLRERFADLDLSGEPYVRARVKRVRKVLDTWLGGATAEQLAILAEAARSGRPQQERYRDAARRNAADLVEALLSRPGAPVLAQLVRTWMTTEQVVPTPAYQAAEAAYRVTLVRLLLRLEATLTPAQRAHFTRELSAWRDDFLDLSRQDP